MKNQLHHTHHHHHPNQQGTNLFRRFNTNQKLSIAFMILSYVILLTISYNSGYHFGSLFTVKDITTSVISKTTSVSQYIIVRSSEPLNKKAATLCGEPVRAESIRQTIIDRVYNGGSPYENFIPARVASSSLLPKGINEQGPYTMVYNSLIHKVRPTTIVKFSNSLGVSATYMSNLTSQLGLKTQILCLDEFPSWSVFRNMFDDVPMPNGDTVSLNQFLQIVISQNATESILPVPLSIDSASESLCEWGIYGDLIEVDAGRDFHSAWSNINKAYKLLRPGGVLFGHKYFSTGSSYYIKGVRQAIRLFARVNKLRVKAGKHHWMIKSA